MSDVARPGRPARPSSPAVESRIVPDERTVPQPETLPAGPQENRTGQPAVADMADDSTAGESTTRF